MERVKVGNTRFGFTLSFWGTGALLLLSLTACSKVNTDFEVLSSPSPVAVATSEAGTSTTTTVVQSSVAPAVQPQLAMSPSTWDYGSVALAANSDKTFTLTNSGSVSTGTLSLSVAGSSISQLSTTCGSSLSPASSCTITLRFAPTVDGLYGAVLSASGTSGGIATARATGIGGAGPTGSPPVLAATPTPVAFANTSVGLYAQTTVTITNSGSGAASNFSAAVLGSGFTLQSQTCGSSLAPAASCVVTLRFTPPANGAWSGALNVIADSTAPISVSLSGIGEGGRAGYTLTPSSYTFPTASPGTQVDATFTVRNVGTAGSTSITPSLSGTGFSVYSTACASGLSVGATCDLVLRFAPTVAGGYAGFLNVNSTGGDGAIATLVGNSPSSGGGGGSPTPTPAQFTSSPSSVTFTTIAAGSTNDQTITISNPGATDITSFTRTLSGSTYTLQSTTCTGTLVSGGSCTVTMRFSPTLAGSFAGNLALAGSGVTTVNVSLDGAATSSTNLSLTPTSHTFPDTMTGATRTRGFVLVNSGGSSSGTIGVSIVGASPSPAAMSISSTDCTGVNLAASGGSCTVLVQYLPTVAGSHIGSLQVTEGGTPVLSAGLDGTASAPSLGISPSSYNFGSVLVGTPQTYTFTISNTGSGTLSGMSVSVLGSAFLVTSDGCAAYATSFPAAQTCNVTVSYTPAASGSDSGFLFVSIPGSNYTAALSGTGGSAASLGLSPSSKAHGTVYTSVPSNQTVVVSNSGGVSATSVTVGLSDTTNYSITSNGCSSGTVAASGSCNVVYRYLPTNESPHPMTLTVNYNDGAVARSVTHTSTGTGKYPPAIAISPTSYDFGDVSLGFIRSRTFTVTNTGTGGATSLSVTPSNSAFSLANNGCTSSLASGASCTFEVDFLPSQVTTYASQSLVVDFAERPYIASPSPAPVSATVSGVVVSGKSWVAQGLNKAQYGQSSLNKQNLAKSGSRWIAPMAKGLVQYSDNDGLTWKIGNAGTWDNLQSVASESSSVAYLGGDDGSNGTLHQMSTSQYGFTLQGNHARWLPSWLMCIGSGSCFGTLQYYGSTFLTSSNSGATWAEPTPTSGWGHYSNYVSDVEYLSATAMVVSHQNGVNSKGSIYRSEDGGLKFRPQLGGWNLRGVARLPTTSIYIAVGDDGWLRRSTDGGLNWATVDFPLRSNLYGVACSSATKCFVIANVSGYPVYVSTDAGATWTLGGNTNLAGLAGGTALSAPSDSVIYAVGSAGLIKKSVDGGTTWTNLPQAVQHPLYGISCSDVNNCLVYGAVSSTTALLLKTTNGGSTWSESISFSYAPYQRVVTANGRVWAITADGYMIRSTDAGVNWTPLAHPRPSPQATSGYGTLSMVYDSGGSAYHGWLSVGTELYKTTDGGDTWSLQYNAPSTIEDVYFTNKDVGWAIASNAIFRTTNGGSTWTSASPLPTSAPLSSLHARRNAGDTAWLVWAAGTYGTMMYSTDGGVSWAAATSISNGNVGSSSSTYKSPYFISDSVGYALRYYAAGGTQGAVIKTTDGGANWTDVCATTQTCGAVGRTAYSRALAFTSDGVEGWSVSTAGASPFARTMDSGATWSSMSTPAPIGDLTYPAAITSILLVSEGTGAAGDSVLLATTNTGAIYRTTDSGANWSVVRTNGGGIESLRYVPGDANTVIMGTTGRHFLKSNDAGVSWTATEISPAPTPSTTLSYMRVIPFNANQWLAFTSNDNAESQAAFVTSNGGSSWTRILLPTPVGVASFGHNDFDVDSAAGTGNIVGNAGGILRVSNFGATVSDYYRNVPEPVGSILGLKFGDTNNGWAVGSESRVYRTTDGGRTWKDAPLTRNSSYNYLDIDMTYDSGAWKGFLVGEKTATYEPIILRSEDGFATASSPLPSPGVSKRPGESLRYVKVIDAGLALAASDDGEIVRLTSTTASTVGAMPSNATIQTMIATDRRTLFLGHDGGVISTSENGGQSWSVTDIDTSDNSDSLYGLDVVGNNVYAVGYQKWYRSTDSGATWSPMPSPISLASKNLNAVDFSGSTGFVVSSSALLFKTSDSGSTWAVMPSPSPVSSPGALPTVPPSVIYNALHVRSSTRAYVAGNSGTVLFTTDGSTWQGQGGVCSGSHLYGISFATDSVGWVVGASGKICKSTDGGATWSVQAVSGNPTNTLYDVKAIDTNTVYVAADTGLFYTDNGGVSWTTTTLTGTGASYPAESGRTFYSIAAPDFYTIWLGGSGGALLRSFSGGRAP